MSRDYPVTGFHSQADAEHRANVTARAAWANPTALARRPSTALDGWGDYMRALQRISFAFSDGGVMRPPTTTELHPRLTVTSWA